MELIAKPTMLLRENVALNNILEMRRRCCSNGKTKFRPHFKTHQSNEISKWFDPIDSITVSSVEMAEYFAQSGSIKDILIAFTVPPVQISEINLKLRTVPFIGVLVETFEAIDSLISQITLPRPNPIQIWIEIDVGQHRTGLNSTDKHPILKLVKYIQEKSSQFPHILQLCGLLTHSGQTYHATSKEEIVRIHDESFRQMSSLRDFIHSQSDKFISLNKLKLSFGDTPSCSIVDPQKIQQWDELRPGNFVFYDSTQLFLGSCLEENISLGIICPIVSIHNERNQVIIHGGSIHLSKELLEEPNSNKSPNYGLIALPNKETGWGKIIKDARVISLTQEHGIIQFYDSPSCEMISKFKIGDLVVVIPVHSCLIVPLLRTYLTTSGRRIETMLSLPCP